VNPLAIRSVSANARALFVFDALAAPIPDL
jgi:hypothetical protein